MTAPSLEPEFAHLADFDGGPSSIADLAAIRAGIAEFFTTPPAIDGVRAHTFTVGSEPGVVVETYTPIGDEPRPALLWFHGGGHLFGSAAMDGVRLQEWAGRLGCLAASVEYRLAPEHPFPCAHDDAVQSLDWLIASADELDVDVRRIVIGGASAGGGLAAGLALAARDRGLRLAGQLLFYPMIDDRERTSSSTWDVPVWSRAANALAWNAYLGADHGGGVPAYAAPARAASLVDLPPSLVLVGGADRFFDEDLDYASRLTRAGVPTDLRVYAGAPHGFDLVAPASAVAQTARVDAERWLTKVFGTTPTSAGENPSDASGGGGGTVGPGARE